MSSMNFSDVIQILHPVTYEYNDVNNGN